MTDKFVSIVVCYILHIHQFVCCITWTHLIISDENKYFSFNSQFVAVDVFIKWNPTKKLVVTVWRDGVWQRNVTLFVLIANSLRINRNLRKLYLADNKLTELDALQLGTLLTVNTSLQLLDLRFDYSLAL